MENRYINVIVDTDIGEDIDDTWALIYILLTRFINVKAIMVSTGDVTYKASLVAKILTLLKKTSIPIILGAETKGEVYAQKRWLNGFSCENYQGTILKDYKKALQKITKEKNLTLIELAPFSTISSKSYVLPMKMNFLKRNTAIF